MAARKSRDGEYTEILGKRLRTDIESVSKGRLRVHFDHAGADSKKIVAHLGGKSSRANALSYVDIAVVEGDRVVLLCEVEEEGARPKKVIGDLCNILFADGVQIGDCQYRLDRTRIVLGVRLDSKGRSEVKINSVITRIKKKVSLGKISDIVLVHGSTYHESSEALHKDVTASLGIS